jgi:hypothetical protein
MAKDYSHLGFVADDEVPVPSPSPSADMGFVPETTEDPSLVGDLLETIGTGAASVGQGLTFGAGTKALGALEALGETEDLSDLEKLYSKYQELSGKRKEQYQELSEKHPFVSTAGEITGAILNPIPGAAAKTAVELAGAAKLAKALQLPVGLVSRMGAGGLLGGGISSVTSEEKGKEYLKDIGRGTAIGMGLGGAEFVGAEKLMPWAKDYIAKSPKIQNIIRSFELARGTPFEMNPEGKPIYLTEPAERAGGGPTPLFKQLDYVKEKMTKSLEKMYNFARKEFDGFFNNHGNEILDFNNPEIKTVLKILEDNKGVLSKALGSDKVENLLQGLPKTGALGELIEGNYKGTVSNFYDLRKALYDKIGHLTDLNVLDRDTQRLLYGEGSKKGVVQLIDDALSSSPKFGAQYSNLKKNVDVAASPFENLLNRDPSDEARVIRLSDLSKDEATKKANAIFGTMAEHLGSTGFSDVKRRIVFNNMIDKYEEVIKTLYQNSPEFKGIMDQLGKIKVKGKTASSSEIEEALTKLQSGEAIESLGGIPISKLPKEMQAALKAEFESLKSRASFEPPAKMEKMTKDVARDISTLKTQTGIRDESDPLLGDIFTKPIGAGSPLELTTRTAATLGSGVRKVEDFAKGLPSYIRAPVTKPVKAAVDLKKATMDQLKEWAEILSKDKRPSVGNIGRAAMSSLEENPVAKAAFLNTIMQNSTARDVLGLSPGKPEKEED